MAQFPSQPWNPAAVVERSSCQHPTPITHPNQSRTTPPSQTTANLHPPRTREDRWQETRPKGWVLFGPHGPLPVPLLTFVSQECPCKATPCPPGASHLLTQCPLKSAQCQREGRRRVLLPESGGSSRSSERKVPVQLRGATELYLWMETEELFSHMTQNNKQASLHQVKNDGLK